jgi:hypothetical protein
VHTGNRIAGSNPASSATFPEAFVYQRLTGVDLSLPLCRV